MKKIVGTMVKEYIWTGGEGAGDEIRLIGYCKDMPVEVLSKIIQSHCIHLYRSIDVSTEYPSNVSGIMIQPLYEDDIRGCDVTGRIEDLYCYIRKYKWNGFSLADSKEVLVKQKLQNYNYTRDAIADFEKVLESLEPDDYMEFLEKNIGGK